MDSDLTYTLTGVVFGLTAGITPGPLLTLVFSETLKHGSKEGVKISFAPVLTDLPIVLGAIYLVSYITNLLILYGIIAISGSIFLSFLAYESIFFKGINTNNASIRPQSIKKGIIANFLNPAPYIFWITIGAPIVLKAKGQSFFSALLFIISMYVCLVGSKILVAILVGRSRLFLKSNIYIYIIKALGIVLFLFAIRFFIEGLYYFAIVDFRL
jgi:threonine/homoserine/homoserine lactone efflux protein